MRRERAEVDVAVVGGGAVGLACAAALAAEGRSVVVLERHAGLGRETTSRNSGVVHAGLYYPPGSLMAETCVEGRRRLYARCLRDGVAHAKLGKLVVAVDDAERAVLEELHARGEANGVEGLTLLEGAEVAALEPRVRAVAALSSTESGIVDAHGLTESYAAEARRAGASVALRTTLEGLAPAGEGVRLDTRSGDEPYALRAAVVVNAAGLAADRVAALAGVDVDARGWRLRYCKGDYFRLAPRLGRVVRRLVYPVPVHAGLGVHLTVDLDGGVRAGPDTEYVDAPRYDVDPRKAAAFAAAVGRYLPGVEAVDLAPDYAGVRPKRYGPGEPRRDFVLAEEPEGVIHLVGIESPGLTASEALARRVCAVAEDRLRG